MSGEFSWLPGEQLDKLTFGKGRAPQMDYSKWNRRGGSEIGATGVDSWYRRCRHRKCRVWAGPYQSIIRAMDDGELHSNTAHREEER